MSDQTNCILDKISENEKFTEAHILHVKNFEKNIRRSEEFCQRDVDENKNSTIQQNNKVIVFLN